MRGDSWDASLLTLPEHQCKPHPADYGLRGPANLRIWKEIDPDTQDLIAYHTHISWQAPERTIWMDGRPHPPEYAAHTWQGFSTGKWEGDMLTVTTDASEDRLDPPQRDSAQRPRVVTEHWIRHGDYLTLVSIVNDPVYLTEPFIRTTDWQSRSAISRSRRIRANRWWKSNGRWAWCRIICRGPTRFSRNSPEHYNSREAARGGAETMYPEYQS